MNKHRDTDRSVTPSKNHSRLLIFGLVGVLAALVIAVIVLTGINDNHSLSGAWHNSEDGQYTFDGQGEGSWTSDDDMGKFRYKVNGDTLRIQFDNKQIADRTYTFYLENDILVLVDEQDVEHRFDPVDRKD